MITSDSIAVHEPSLKEGIDGFLIDRQARQLSPRTVAWYAEKLGILEAYLEGRGIADISTLTSHIIRQYLLKMAETHNAGGVHGLYRALRAFLRWYEDEFEPIGWRNPLRRVRAPRVPEQVLEPVPLSDVKAMVSVCPSDTKLGCRDRAILLALLDTGCRAQEFLDLSLGDVDLNIGTCQVLCGKGGKPRVVFLGDQALAALRAYLAYRDSGDVLAPLWATRNETRLTYAGLREIVRRRARKAGVPAPGLHAFRRAFALCCLRRGMNIFSLQRLMGHSDISILRRYLAQRQDDLLREHRKHGPVDAAFGNDDQNESEKEIL